MRRAAVLIAVGTVSLLAVAQTAWAGRSGHGVTRGQDPYASCSVGADDFGGVVFPATEPEVWLSSNPVNPRSLIGSIQQDRWSDGGAKGLVATVSGDGGGKWSEVPLPFSACAAPYYHGAVVTDPFSGRDGAPVYFDRASDPWVSVGPDGEAYAVSASFDANDNGGGVAAATSTDGGHTWRNAQMVIAEDPADPSFPFDDKESVTADPTRPGVAYAVWDRTKEIACPARAGKPEHGPVRRDGAFLTATAADQPDCYDGPTMMSRTTDGGRTWSTPQVIVATAANEQTIANQIVVSPDGVLHDFYMYIHADLSLTVENVASHDEGATWGPRYVISDSHTVGVHDPLTGAPVRTGDIIPEPAVDRATGELYVVWQDSRANHVDGSEDGLFISSSSDGANWSPPAPVNDPRDGAAFTPAIAVGRHGSVTVEYYAFRHRENESGVLPTNAVLRSTRGPGTAFGGGEQELGNFNMLAAPFSRGYFTGDYEGLAIDGAHQQQVHTFYTAATCDDTRCDAVAGFDADFNPVPSDVPDPTDVFSQRRSSH